MVTFGARLRALRTAAGLTQEELASRAGLTANGVSALERGTRLRPYPHTIQVLAEALGLSDLERRDLSAAAAGGGAPEPAPRAVGVSNLVAPPTPLLGREDDVQRLVRLVQSEDHRLVTLTGPGGVGKTRLAIEVAHRAAPAFSDGVAFAALAPLSEPAMVLSVAAASVSGREGASPAQASAPLEHFRGRDLLLVLDNFEHLMDAAADVAELVNACPTITVLVTSRARLRLRAETDVPVQPLGLPRSTTAPTVEQVESSAAGQLFLDRARAARPGFEITPQSSASISAICWRLGGLPLALELAASKVGVLPPMLLLERLDTALSAGWARDLPARQHTLRATLDWSYRLLDEEAQLLLRHVSVFAGGFTLDALEGVAGAALGGDRVLPTLERLVEHSLVMPVEEPDGGVRYTVLEPIREYARAHLQDEHEEVLRRRHAEYFLAIAEAASPERTARGRAQRFDRPQWETDNVRAAMSWVLARGDAEIAVRLGWALCLVWWMTGQLAEGRRWMEVALDLDMAPAYRSRALQVRATMCYAEGNLAAAASSWDAALQLARTSGDAIAEACALAGCGLVAATTDPTLAADRLRESIDLAAAAGDEWLQFLASIWLGSVLLVNGDAAGARPVFQEATLAARRRGDRLVAYVALFNLARAFIALEDHRAATGALQESITLSAESGDRANLAYALELLAVVQGAGNDWPAAATLIGAAEALRDSSTGPVRSFYLPDEDLRTRTLERATDVLGPSAFDAAMSDGRRMGPGEAAGYALSLATGTPGR